MSKRLLTRIENGVCCFGMNLMASFELANNILSIDKNLIKQAVVLAAKKYPYLRTMLSKDEENRLQFVEKNIEEFDTFEVQWFDVTDVEKFNEWEKRFNFFSSVNYNLAKFIFYIEVYHLVPNKYQLYFAVNHAGCDGRGCFAMLKDVLFFIDLKVSEPDFSDVKSKPFIDLFNNLEHSYDIEALKREPVYKCEFHDYIKALDRHETDASSLSIYQISYISQFKKFNVDQSRRLFINSKLNSTTLQGIVSVANMIALINEKINLLENNSWPVECLNVALIDMRYLFNLDVDDVFKAPSSLTWVQSLPHLRVNLWELASQVSQILKKMRRENEGLKWWVKSMNSIQLPILRSWSSSIGVINLDDEKFKNIKVDDLRFFLSFPTTPFELHKKEIYNHINVHAFTFKEKFTVVFGHSYPTLSIEWGKNYARNVFRIMETFAECNGQITLESIASQLGRLN